MKDILKDPNGLKSILQKGDICVVDRGFGDVKEYLEQQGYQIFMPALKGNFQKMLIKYFGLKITIIIIYYHLNDFI